jgi:hypothetical protein
MEVKEATGREGLVAQTSKMKASPYGKKLGGTCIRRASLLHAINSCHVSILKNPTAHGGVGKATAWETTIGACGVYEELV